MLSSNKLHKLFHWEYWPLLMFYIPNIPYALAHAIWSRSLVFYTAVNPSITNSGIGSESKYQTLNLFPKKYIPTSILHKKNDDIIKTIKACNKIGFPVIAKPDVGFRGMLVTKINSKEELTNYLNKFPIDVLIQEYLTHQYECGIFYHRFPTEEKGSITSITLKNFMQVTGDGKKTIRELILSNKRTKLYFPCIQNDCSINFDEVLKKNEIKQLSAIGNHSKGTEFINGNHLINNELNSCFDELNHQVKGWYYGRVDIKYNSVDELNKGEFKILELNGILAEPTHIYDASNMTYFKALKTIRVHWKALYKIAVYNHKKEKVSYRKTYPFIKEMIALKRYAKQVNKLANS